MGDVPRIGIAGIRFRDGPRGVIIGKSTAFPVSMARDTTWDISLEE
jgi:beta-glucosidase